MRALRLLVSALVVTTLVMLASFPTYRENRVIESDGIANCIRGYVGSDASTEYIREYDWAWLKTLTTAQIMTKVNISSPHPENVLNNCLGRLSI